MDNKKKKELIKAILNNSVTNDDYDDLIETLIDNPISVNFDKEDKRTFGEKVADKLTLVAGSWTFIIGFVIFLALWIIFNLYLGDKIDPYPFILLNLMLSCLAALQAPVIMMSQNREAKKESEKTANDYKTDLKSELILEELHDQMDEILKNQEKILNYINKNRK